MLFNNYCPLLLFGCATNGFLKLTHGGFPGGSVVKNTPDNAEDAKDTGSIPGLGRASGVGYNNTLQYSCQENSMGMGAWKTIVPEITKESDMTEHTHIHTHTKLTGFND